ncbi:MAG TPA: hypothetical protein VGN96_08145 [Roseococcus sp.]|jgi:hypothetical protein|nr:hypothetical protein [Roseococcus sp.]
MLPPVVLAPCVIIHGAPELAAVLALAGDRRPRLLSAPGAAAWWGVEGFRALLDAHGALPLGILDTADAPGHALAALRAGFPTVVLDPAVPAFPALAALFAEEGATLLPEAPPALDLARVQLHKPAGRRHLARWLGLPRIHDLA